MSALGLTTEVTLDRGFAEIELDEHGRGLMFRKGGSHVIGRTNAACAEMRRFVRAMVLARGN